MSKFPNDEGADQNEISNSKPAHTMDESLTQAGLSIILVPCGEYIILQIVYLV